MTQRQRADLMGFKLGSLGAWENYRSDISVRRAQWALARIGLDLGDVLIRKDLESRSWLGVDQ